MTVGADELGSHQKKYQNPVFQVLVDLCRLDEQPESISHQAVLAVDRSSFNIISRSTCASDTKCA